MLILHILISLCLSIATIVGTFVQGVDVTSLGILAGTSFVTDGAWGGFYYWKSKNENRSKYTQKFIHLLAKEYGVDSALRAAELVLKD